MANGCISISRILERLDELLGKNDYAAAERHLLYWLAESSGACDGRTELLIRNELMGLYRKLGREADALAAVDAATKKIDELGVGDQVGSATTFLNAATVYKSFGKAADAMPLFERARRIYERDLAPDDARLGGLYNNMALALVDLGRYTEAKALYESAISVMKRQPSGDLEVAITYLNLASAAEAELGLLEADAEIQKYLDDAEALLEAHEKRDGYYAFVCEKCASVFGYYGRFFYENDLKERARRIYER